MKLSVIRHTFSLFFFCDLFSKTLTFPFPTGIKSTRYSHFINLFPFNREEVTALDDLTVDVLKDEIGRLNTKLEDTEADLEKSEFCAQQAQGKADTLRKEFEAEVSSTGDLIITLLKEIEKGKDKLANRMVRFVDELQQSKEREEKLETTIKELDTTVRKQNQSLIELQNLTSSQSVMQEKEFDELKNEYTERINEVVDELEFGQMERKKIEIQYKKSKENEKRLEASVTSLDNVLTKANLSLMNATSEIQNLEEKNENLQLKYSNEVNALTKAIKNEETERNNVEAQMKLVKVDMARQLTAKTSDYMQLKAKSLEEMEQLRKEKSEEINVRDMQIEEYEIERSQLRSLAKQSLSLTKTRIVNLYRRARRKKIN